MASPIISTRGLSKTYYLGQQTVQALRGIDIDIVSGEFVAVMGPSGSGKSTFMNLLGCLDPPTAGAYQLGGKDVAHLEADALADIRNRSIGFVFQNFNLLARTSAHENVELPLLYCDAPAAEQRERALQALDAVGLADRADHHPSQLSGGQQQRVAIARALINNPLLILADEPTGALDSRTGLEVMALFQQLNRKGMTIILVTHDADIAEFANRRLRFRDGLLIEDTVIAKPRDAAALLTETVKPS